MFDALVWILAVELLGLLAFPLAFVLFHRLPDRGFTVAKPLALILFSYALWILGLTHLIANTRFTIVGILAVCAVISALVLKNQAQNIKAFFKMEWRLVAAGEAVFLLFFVLWAAIASESPAITHTEKPMDFGFLNAVLQSRFFPPEDPWLAGHSISYYYFGHFTMALVVKLTGISSAVGYNLAVSLVPALLATGAMGLLYNLIRLSGAGRPRAVFFALAAPAMIILLGNLEGTLEFVHLRGWGSAGFWDWAGIKGLTGLNGATASGLFPSDPWWWWRATRVIDTVAGGHSLDYTITEFPFFSFLLGDLHPHVLGLPFVVLGISLCFNLFLIRDAPGLSWLRKHPLESLAMAFFVGSLAFINTWDFPLLAGILGAVILARSYAAQNGALGRAASQAAIMFAPLLVLSVAMFLPFYLGFGSQASGILPLQDHPTRPVLFFLVMGLFSFVGISFVLGQLGNLGLTRLSFRGILRARQGEDIQDEGSEYDAPAALAIGLFTLAPLALWIALVWVWTLFTGGPAAAIAEVAGRTVWVLPGLALVAMAGYSAIRLSRLEKDLASAFPLVLFAAAFFLIAGAELFYVADSFGGGYRRMNTVFKVYYQGWLLLGLVAAYGIYHWFSSPETNGDSPANSVRVWAGKAGRGLWAGSLVLLVLASLYYPAGAALDRTGWLGRNHTLSANTLDGLDFLKSQQPGEYAAIQWLRDDAPWGRLAEAVGSDYSDYGRISSSTGLPAILGWKGHELQWRGSSRLFDGRETDVAKIYQSPSEEEVRQILERYQVRYVYLGHREISSYGGETLAGFANLLRTAFTADGVIIYERLP
ncbi:MAG: hypothetical protein BZY80_01835 [SAR202 cluster bacterium Io17-Chloro-G2]|nr:MAG: hypothetical protein BZY80_01835 [SAR202 cluster bacterium Io17-Chloro-G2]